MKGIKNIIYEFNGICIFNISLDNNHIIYKDVSGTITKDKMIEYIRNLYGIINGWDEEYISTKLIDNSNWELEIIFTNGNKKQYRGKSEYPYNFEAFERLNQELINEVLNGKI